jgi:hypothetical protein
VNRLSPAGRSLAVFDRFVSGARTDRRSTGVSQLAAAAVSLEIRSASQVRGQVAQVSAGLSV